MKGKALCILFFKKWFKVSSIFIFVFLILISCLNLFPCISFSADVNLEQIMREKIRVVVQTANIRLRPSVESPIIGIANKNEIFTIFHKVGNWFLISLPPDEKGFIKYGYIHENDIEEIKEEKKEIEEKKILEEIREAKKEKIEELEKEKIVTHKEEKINIHGSWEFSISASYIISKAISDKSTDTIKTLYVPFGIGYFITPQLEIQLEISFNHLSQDDFITKDISAVINILYNLNLNRIIMPFISVGSGIMYIFSNFGENAIGQTRFAINGGAGVRFFTSKNASLRAEYRFLFYSYKSEMEQAKINFIDHKFLVGLSIFF